MVKEIHGMAEFTAEVATGVSVVDFWASWCGPCKYIAPMFVEMSSRFTSVKFLKVDVDANEEVSEAQGVSAMPTFLLFKDGKKVDEFIGADATGLEAMIAKHAL